MTDTKAHVSIKTHNGLGLYGFRVKVYPHDPQTDDIITRELPSDGGQICVTIPKPSPPRTIHLELRGTTLPIQPGDPDYENYVHTVSFPPDGSDKTYDFIFEDCPQVAADSYVHSEDEGSIPNLVNREEPVELVEDSRSIVNLDCVDVYLRGFIDDEDMATPRKVRMVFHDLLQAMTKTKQTTVSVDHQGRHVHTAHFNIRKSRNTCYLIIEHPGETAVFQLPKILSKVTKLGLYRNGRDLRMYFDQS